MTSRTHAADTRSVEYWLAQSRAVRPARRRRRHVDPAVPAVMLSLVALVIVTLLSRIA